MLWMRRKRDDDTLESSRLRLLLQLFENGTMSQMYAIECADGDNSAADIGKLVGINDVLHGVTFRLYRNLAPISRSKAAIN